MNLLLNGDLTEQKALLWYAVCMRYAFIRDFAIEVVQNKFVAMDLFLSESDYYAFVGRKALDHPELEDLKPSTSRKAYTVLFRMMREAGILSEQQTIVPMTLSRRLIEALVEDDPDALRVFPTYNLA